MRSIAILVGLAIASLAACTSAGSPSPSGDDEFTLPSPSAGGNKLSPPIGPRSVTGMLSFDDIEGGCAFIQTDDGRKYEVIYPSGWQLDRQAAVLRGPNGEVARAGDRLIVSGAVATDRSSICQVGPIFQATAVEIPAR